MNEKNLEQILPLFFRQIEVPRKSKEKLRRQLFCKEEISDHDAGLIAAAGEPGTLNQTGELFL
jgi:hypothetical protein